MNRKIILICALLSILVLSSCGDITGEATKDLNENLESLQEVTKVMSDVREQQRQVGRDDPEMCKTLEEVCRLHGAGCNEYYTYCI